MHDVCHKANICATNFNLFLSALFQFSIDWRSLNMLGTDLVWARDSHEGYIQGRIIELGAHEYEILPVDKSHQKRTSSIDDVFPSCEAKSDHDDNCK